MMLKSQARSAMALWAGWDESFDRLADYLEDN
jgi:uncharacterized protein YndB with AHSA1/START domain